MAAAAAHAKDAKDAKDAKELTLYISAHGLELGSSKPLKSSNKKYNTFLEKCLIVYEQGCSGLENEGDTKIDKFYKAFRDGKERDTEDILESVSSVLRYEKCKEYGQSHGKMIMRRRDIETQFKRISTPHLLRKFAYKLLDKLQNYSDAIGRGKILIDRKDPSFIDDGNLKKLVDENSFKDFCKKLSERLVTDIDYELFMGLFSMAIEETEPAPKFAEDLFRCSLYSSYKLVNPLNDKKFFMSGKDESPEDVAYMNYGIHLIDIRGVDGGKDDGVINLLEKKHGYKFKFNLEQDNTICLSDILFECFKCGFDKVNIIDSSCRSYSSDDYKKVDGLGGVLTTEEISFWERFGAKMHEMNNSESRKSRKRKSSSISKFLSKKSKKSKKPKKRSITRRRACSPLCKRV